MRVLFKQPELVIIAKREWNIRRVMAHDLEQAFSLVLDLAVVVTGQHRCAHQSLLLAPCAEANMRVVDFGELLGLVFAGVKPVTHVKRPGEAVRRDCLGVIQCDHVHDAAKGIENPLAVTYDVHSLYIA